MRLKTLVTELKLNKFRKLIKKYNEISEKHEALYLSVLYQHKCFIVYLIKTNTYLSYYINNNFSLIHIAIPLSNTSFKILLDYGSNLFIQESRFRKICIMTTCYCHGYINHFNDYLQVLI